MLPYLVEPFSGSRAFPPGLFRGWRMDYGRIDNAAARQQQALLDQVCLGFFKKDRPCEPIVFQQVGEVQGSGLHWDGAFAHFQVHKLAHRLPFAQGLLKPKVGQAVPLPQAVYPKHHFQSPQSTTFPHLRVMGFNKTL
jgi:hypothetical protein